MTSPSQTLDALPVGTRARVADITLEPDEAQWLHSLGIFPGTVVIVLRHALFGGALHVRTDGGGEFAIDRSYASNVYVAPTMDE